LSETADYILDESLGCLFLLYQIVGYIVGAVVYGGVALLLLVSGDIPRLLGWVFLVGPIISPVLAILWPLAAIGWLVSIFF
jgi:hypothetical protein